LKNLFFIHSRTNDLFLFTAKTGFIAVLNLDTIM
jgi:hypothetical protein